MKSSGPPLIVEEDRDGFRFRGGSVALDLSATLQARLKPEPRELLATPADLDRWLVSAGLASTAPGADMDDLVAARELREAIFAIAGSLNKRSFDRAACDVLNKFAADAPPAPVLSPDGQLSWNGAVPALLAGMAREAAALFAEMASRIRQCHSPSCTIYFVDTSRAGRRRWCSMAACGNKAKVAALRRRERPKTA
jgi:predicted RNA-binding Zn ribbon-like protein